jgi:hypothetical protein
LNDRELDDLETEESAEFEDDTVDDAAIPTLADTCDPIPIVEAKIPRDIRERYEVYSYRNAAVILSETRKIEFEDILKALRALDVSEGPPI